jgi:hypothetical protein
MTSVLAWIAADKRRPTGLYFATDSRRTIKLPNSEKVVYDNCVKTFVADGTAEIFAFAGDATFPPAALSDICTVLAKEAEDYNALSEYDRSAYVFQLLREAFDALSTKPDYAFWILHGTRTGAMYNARFHLFQYSYHLGSLYLSFGTLPVEPGQSVALSMLGTGQSMVESSVNEQITLVGNVSRVQFSAFCAAVQEKTANKDDWSGGPIQLVGILSIGNSLHMGVVTPDGTYFRGSTNLPSNAKSFYWRNTQFENVDEKGRLRRGLIK